MNPTPDSSMYPQQQMQDSELWRESNWLSPDSPNAHQPFDYFTGSDHSPSPTTSVDGVQGPGTPTGLRSTSDLGPHAQDGVLQFAEPLSGVAHDHQGLDLSLDPSANVSHSELANALNELNLPNDSRVPSNPELDDPDSPAITIQPPTRSATMISPPEDAGADAYINPYPYDGMGTSTNYGSLEYGSVSQSFTATPLSSETHGSPQEFYTQLPTTAPEFDLRLDTNALTSYAPVSTSPVDANTGYVYPHQVSPTNHTPVETPTLSPHTPPSLNNPQAWVQYGPEGQYNQGSYQVSLSAPFQYSPTAMDPTQSFPVSNTGSVSGHVRRARSLTDNHYRVGGNPPAPTHAYSQPEYGTVHAMSDTHLVPRGEPHSRGRSLSLRGPGGQAGRGRGSSNRNSPYSSRPNSRGHSPASDGGQPHTPPSSTFAELDNLGLPNISGTGRGRPRGHSTGQLGHIPPMMHGSARPFAFEPMSSGPAGGEQGVIGISITGRPDVNVVKPVVGTEGIVQAAEKNRKKEAKYHCSFCGQGLTTRVNRDNHEKAHQGIKPHKCGVNGCEDAFTRKADRDRHVKNMHKDYVSPSWKAASLSKQPSPISPSPSHSSNSPNGATGEWS